MLLLSILSVFWNPNLVKNLKNSPVLKVPLILREWPEGGKEEKAITRQRAIRQTNEDKNMLVTIYPSRFSSCRHCWWLYTHMVGEKCVSTKCQQRQHFSMLLLHAHTRKVREEREQAENSWKLRTRGCRQKGAF